MAKKPYRVTVTETYRKDIVVWVEEAEDKFLMEQEACDIAYEAFSDESVGMDVTDYFGLEVTYLQTASASDTKALANFGRPN
jgi:hypothetical protein